MNNSKLSLTALIYSLIFKQILCAYCSLYSDLTIDGDHIPAPAN